MRAFRLNNAHRERRRAGGDERIWRGDFVHVGVELDLEVGPLGPFFLDEIGVAIAPASCPRQNAGVPELPDFKIKLYADMDEVTRQIRSSLQLVVAHDERYSIEMRASRALRHRPSVQSSTRHPVGRGRRGRADVAGSYPAGDVVLTRRCGKKAIHLRKEVPARREPTPGGALREVLYLIEQGVLSVADAMTP